MKVQHFSTLRNNTYLLPSCPCHHYWLLRFPNPLKSTNFSIGGPGVWKEIEGKGYFISLFYGHDLTICHGHHDFDSLEKYHHNLQGSI